MAIIEKRARALECCGQVLLGWGAKNAAEHKITVDNGTAIAKLGRPSAEARGHNFAFGHLLPTLCHLCYNGGGRLSNPERQ